MNVRSLWSWTLTCTLAGAMSVSCGSPEVAPLDEDASNVSTPGSASSGATDLYYRSFGERKNPAVIFVHGGPGASSYAFEGAVAPALAERGYFVVAYDQRGSGRSPRGKPADYSYKGATRDLDVLIKTLGVSHPTLLGHSFGGSIALHYLELYPNVAKSLVLIGSPMRFPDTYFTILDRAAEAFAFRLDFFKSEELRQLKKRMFPNGLVPPFTYSGEDIGVVAQSMNTAGLTLPTLPSLEALGLVAELSLGPDGTLFTSANPEVGDGFHTNDRVGYADFIPLLAKHREVVSGVYGDEDAIFSDTHIGAIKTTLPQQHFTMMTHSAHYPFVDQPKQLVDALAEQLALLK